MQSKSSNSFDLYNKTVIVTGSARGNGFAIAKELYEYGANIVIIDKSKIELDKSSSSFDSERCLKILTDINSKSGREKIVKKTINKFNNIDGLINNAGISISRSSESYKEKDWDQTLTTNLSSTFYLSQIVAKVMIKNKKGGSIINITSLSANFGMPSNPAYVASKGGLRFLTKAMAVDWGKYNIRVNNICPGYIKTNMTSKSFGNLKTRKKRSSRTILNRWGHSKDLVGAAIFLISDASTYITGIDLEIDGGWSAKGL